MSQELLFKTSMAKPSRLKLCCWVLKLIQQGPHIRGFFGISEFMQCSFCFQDQNRAARGLALWVWADLFKTVNNTIVMPFVKPQQPKSHVTNQAKFVQQKPLKTFENLTSQESRFKTSMAKPSKADLSCAVGCSS